MLCGDRGRRRRRHGVVVDQDAECPNFQTTIDRCADDVLPHHASRRPRAMSIYYDINDFLAADHGVPVSFEKGALGLGAEISGSRAPRNEHIARDHAGEVPLWWLEGALVDELDITGLPACLGNDVFAELGAEQGARIADLRATNESFFGFGAGFASALAKQCDDGDEDEDVVLIRDKLEEAYLRRWREVLWEACGRSSDVGKLERLLTREERETWDEGRRSMTTYERWRYGRGERIETAKIVRDAKKKQRMG
jgi:hypothetical protein